MHGETDLQTLLSTMQPYLHDLPYVFSSVPRDRFARLSFEPLGVFHEQEGITIISTQQQARDSGLPFEPTWACISLRVYSSLSAVGFMAAVAGALARAGISVNPVSAYYHDHLFVPWAKRRQAVEALGMLGRSPKREPGKKSDPE
jgi:hypothetical protein